MVKVDAEVLKVVVVIGVEVLEKVEVMILLESLEEEEEEEAAFFCRINGRQSDGAFWG